DLHPPAAVLLDSLSPRHQHLGVRRCLRAEKVMELEGNFCVLCPRLTKHERRCESAGADAQELPATEHGPSSSSCPWREMSRTPCPGRRGYSRWHSLQRWFCCKPFRNCRLRPVIRSVA